MAKDTEKGLIDYNIKTKDSFTVIRLGPDHPPICKTVYGTVPCTIAGTPTMAMTADGRYGLITNHGFRPKAWGPIKHPTSEPLTNDDIDDAKRPVQELAPPLSNMISMIDLGSPDFPVVHRVLFEDYPAHVLPHPDGQHFVVGGSENFYVFKIQDGKLVEVSRSHHGKGFPCFWINPAGDRIIATQGNVDLREQPAAIHWYSFSPQEVRHLSDVKVQRGTNTRLLPESYILRISLDGKKALVCQNSSGDAGILCDVPIVDLTKNPPIINSVIKQVADTCRKFRIPSQWKDGGGHMRVLDQRQHRRARYANPIRRNCSTILTLVASLRELNSRQTATNSSWVLPSRTVSTYSMWLATSICGRTRSSLKTGNGHCSLTLGPTWGNNHH